MGFWSSFFGHAAANAYNEMKKEEKKTQQWNDNLHMTMNYEEEFSNYLKSIGSNAVYISEVDESAASVRNQINRYKGKIREYLNLGGQGKYIYDVEELDEYIEVIKYLKSVDCIDRQEEFLGLDLFFAKDTIEREKEEQKFQREMEITETVGSDINSLSGVEFEKVCQQLVEKMGFETETTKASGDGGIDLIAYNHQPLLSGKYIIQCKRYSGSVGEPIIRDLYGVVTSERANKGILMTTGYFTKSAIAFAEGKPIELIDGEKLKSLLLQFGCIIDSDEGNDEDDIELYKKNQIYSIQEIFDRNPIDIDEYNEMVNEISLKYNDRKCAKLIIYLISEWSIMKFDEKISIIPEINKYIEFYIKNAKENEKCKWLSYLLMMCYIQFSIISGEFNNAKIMFDNLMSNKELLFTDLDFIEPTDTDEMCKDHLGVFLCLYDTMYNMMQLCSVVKDDKFKEVINEKYGFSIVKIFTTDLWEESIENIDSDAPYADLKIAHWNDELEASYNVNNINRIYLISDFELEMYYNYAYENGTVGSLSPNSLDMKMLRNFASADDEIIYGDWYLSFEYSNGTDYGNLYNLSEKIEKYNMVQ